MKLHTLLIVGLALGVTGCAEKEKVAPTQGEDAQVAAEPAAADLAAAEEAKVGTEAFVRHMHLHASQYKRLSDALDAGDLEAAQTPAYWLSRHEAVSGAPDDWQQYIQSMRAAAGAVTDAPDLEAARAAAEGIAESCRGCHIAAWVDVPNLLPDQPIDN
jgi:hypothetical protein